MRRERMQLLGMDIDAGYVYNPNPVLLPLILSSPSRPIQSLRAKTTYLEVKSQNRQTTVVLSRFSLRYVTFTRLVVPVTQHAG